MIYRPLAQPWALWDDRMEPPALPQPTGRKQRIGQHSILERGQGTAGAGRRPGPRVPSPWLLFQPAQGCRAHEDQLSRHLCPALVFCSFGAARLSQLRSRDCALMSMRLQSCSTVGCPLPMTAPSTATPCSPLGTMVRARIGPQGTGLLRSPLGLTVETHRPCP